MVIKKLIHPIRLQELGGIFFVLLISAWIHRSLLGSLTTHLFDWNDYPLLLWIMDQHIDHFSRADFSRFFQGNIFYPEHSQALLFSDLILPSSILGFVISFCTDNRVLTLNLVFFFTWFLNAIASWWLWKKLLSGVYLGVAVVLTSFMPFVLVNTAHFQLLTLWPFLFGFSYLLQNTLRLKHAVLLGVVTGILFCSSVYLAVFFLWSVATWILCQFFFSKNKQSTFISLAKWLMYYFLAVCLIGGFFILQYMKVREQYQINRTYEEYILYASSLSDYFSIKNYHSFLSRSALGKLWNDQISVSAYSLFPTFTLTLLSFIGGWQILKNHTFASHKKTAVFMMLILIQGLVFSLGPRLKWNDQYIGIPLPYSILLKLIPILEPIRGTSRWSLLFFMGLLFFAVMGLKFLSTLKISPIKKTIILSFIAVLFFVEVLPLNRVATTGSNTVDSTQQLTTLCSDQPKVVLEYPFIYNPYGDIRGVEDQLHHWSDILFSATQHNCSVINGYSGFFPQKHDELMHSIEQSIQSSNCQALLNTFTEVQVGVLRLHQDKVDRAVLPFLTTCFQHFERTTFPQPQTTYQVNVNE